MKKHTKLVVLLAITLFSINTNVQAQPIDREMYAKVVKMNNNRNCPFEDDFWTVDKITYQSGYLIFNITLEDSPLLNKDSSYLRNLFADNIRYSVEPAEFSYLLEKLSDINGGFVCNVSTEDPKSLKSFKFTPAEARQIWADRSKPAYKDGEKWQERFNLEMELMQTEFEADKIVDKTNPIRIDSAKIVVDTVVFYATMCNSHFKISKERGADFIQMEIEKSVLGDADIIETLIDADLSLKYIYHNESHTESQSVLITKSRLGKLLEKSENVSPASYEQMELYMHEIAKEFMDDDVKQAYLSDEVLDIQGAYENGVLQLVLVTPDNSPITNINTEEEKIIEDNITVQLKQSLEEQFPIVFNDKVLITIDDFYKHLKGLQILYMEQHTHKTKEMFITSEELKNAKLPVVSFGSEETKQKVTDQLKANLFAEEIKTANASLPLTSNGMILYKIDYDTEYLRYFFTTDSEHLMSTDADVLKKSVRQQLVYNNDFLDNLIDLNSGLVYDYKISDTKKSVEIKYTVEELKEIRSESLNSDQNAIKALQEVVNNSNSACPIRIDEYTTLDSVRLTDNKLTYFETIGTPVDITEKSFKPLLIQSLIESDDRSTRYTIEMCVKTNTHLCYYISLPEDKNGKNTKTKKQGKKSILKICITVDELKQILG